MTDVRSLLRSERASRRIDHPNASYSATGTLECNVCHIPIKSDSDVWNKHLKSTQHVMRAERLRVSQNFPPQRPDSTNQAHITSLTTTKKRKAIDEDDEDTRKRTRPVVRLSRGLFADQVEAKSQNTHPTTNEQSLPAKPLPQNPPTTEIPPAQLQDPVDEAEWAAFEREVATPPPSMLAPNAPSALTTDATITAAPISAAELAAQQKEEERTTGKERREAEIEAEKEDAARALEDEFDEMEGLEERVRRLREKREELRRRRGSEIKKEKKEEMSERVGIGGEEAEEESSEEDFDGWGFGR
ncbi:uncharacterized protein KY384_002716 [Bacidia gigantensis]|uniref:uncharacterized protein n=1 Tax=Bacidia gigantensis TaxID=2732470 RepID=UPI001D03646F|nr:uncharacterized protein KY384_002716 [Bacidia gigantensis]KAG8532838.1 hypothetical protein KY384_002716 [Bacidia gigantensis]